MPTSTPTGILLVGHGTRDPRGIEEFFRLAGLIDASGEIVEPCFLELAEPTIAEGVERLARRGVREAVVAPLLLFAAGHAKRDVPEAVSDAAKGHNLNLRQASVLDGHPRLLSLSERRCVEALAQAGILPSTAETTLLLVGRGSSDPQATAAMRQFAALRGSRNPTITVETCFVTAQRPSLNEALEQVVAAPPAVVVVQPHLLFHGHVFDDIRRAVSDAQRRRPATRWLLTEPLGPEPELAAAVLDLAGRAMPAS